MTSGSSARPTDNTLYALTMPETSDMQRSHQTRAVKHGTATMLVVCTLLFAPAVLHAQMTGRRQRASTPPETPPTPPSPAAAPAPVTPPAAASAPARVTAPAPASAPAPAPVTQQPPTPPTSPPGRADVTYANGLLSISAANSSLNQILREISRLTGMKITGGVIDERVFGTYGPGSPAKILTSLLDGTGSNVLLIQSPKGSPAGSTVSSNSAPVELVLTPRHGGPTPPNPNTPGFNDGFQPDDNRPPQTIMNRPLPPPSVPVADPNSTVRSPIAPATTSVPPPPATPPDPTAPTTQDQSPNGVKTPQQIYDQLLKLRQQQQAPPPSN